MRFFLNVVAYFLNDHLDVILLLILLLETVEQRYHVLVAVKEANDSPKHGPEPVQVINLLLDERL